MLESSLSHLHMTCPLRDTKLSRLHLRTMDSTSWPSCHAVELQWVSMKSPQTCEISTTWQFTTRKSQFALSASALLDTFTHAHMTAQCCCARHALHYKKEADAPFGERFSAVHFHSLVLFTVLVSSSTSSYDLFSSSGSH